MIHSYLFADMYTTLFVKFMLRVAGIAPVLKEVGRLLKLRDARSAALAFCYADTPDKNVEKSYCQSMMFD